MKSTANREKPAAPNWPLLIFVAICALGAGITGTMLWMQSRQQSTLVPISDAPSAPATTTITAAESEADAPSTHEPPPNLTVGLAPPQAALMLGNWYYDHKVWSRAIENYQSALKAGLDNADVRTDLGSAYRFNGDAKKALEQYAIAQKQDPTHENSLFNQGGLYAFDLKQPQKGIELWRKYLQQFPTGQNVEQARQLIEKARTQMKSTANQS